LWINKAILYGTKIKKGTIAMEELIKVKLPKCLVLLTSYEINQMLLKNLDIFEVAIKRGKAFKRFNHKR